jgi:alkanesulfonate monooxygenase SsuD/methylene tetrahydromethanopterin reductase-like flavin-dependent oxidoreductase (luciferase family)
LNDGEEAVMEFGIFDHVDRNRDGPSLREFYESRLTIIEAFDRYGFYAYHLAEHHSTPLGMVPSPSVFLSAIAQRTTRLRFGPFVWPLPFYHPLRIAEEICMLDQMSGGRLELGFGRGSSPIELRYHGVDPGKAQAMYTEGLELVRQALTSRVVNFDGEFYQVRNVPIELETLQKPLPPIWYGAHSPESAERAARRGLNIVNNDGPAVAIPTLERFRDVWRELHGAAPLPLTGLVRFIVVAETDQAALAIARRAYPRWFDSFTLLWRKHGQTPTLGERSPDFDGLRDHEGKGVAGSPATVAAYLRDHLQLTGANYLVGQFVFGDMSLAETLRSIELFAEQVMPVLRS